MSFTLRALDDAAGVWRLAHELGMGDAGTWDTLATADGVIDPGAVLPVHRELVEAQLVEAGAQNYRRAARRLRTMRSLAARTDRIDEVDAIIAELRKTHRRRPRLLTEFDRAGLP